MRLPLLLGLFGCPGDGDDTGKVITSPTDDTGEHDIVTDTTPIYVSTETCASCGGDCRIDELVYPARYHVTDPIDYPDRPPAGGPHDPCWSSWGVHETPVEDDNWVHNLEHGAVVFLHNCTDCDAEITAIAGVATSAGDFSLVTPYALMEEKYAVVAWGWRMVSGCFDPAATEAFYTAHADQGPESSTSDPSTACM